MRRAWFLLTLALTGCLALTDASGPWPCTSDADCTGGNVCLQQDGRQQCVPQGTCATDNDCAVLSPSTPICTSGSCVCPTGVICSGVCADLSRDYSNCGACGNQCGASETCTSGSCECAYGQRCGSDGCIDTSSDARHCGACDTKCDPGVSCSGGACQCGGGLTTCGGHCVDVTSDPKNCASCGAACPSAGQACESGKCVCPTGNMACPDACADVQTDANHCGSCDTKCSVPGQTCITGACVCPNQGTICGGACTDTQNDAHNCGGCGVTCAGQCSLGRCLVTVATGQGGAAAIAVDGTHVYWTATADGTVMMAPKSGGGPTSLATGQGRPTSIALDSTNVYWTNTMSGEVMTAPIAGGNATALATGESSPSTITVSNLGVLWLSPSGGVRRVAKTGGAVSTYLSPYGQIGLAADATYIYTTQPYNGSFPYNIVRATPYNTPQVLAGTVTPNALTIDDTNVYVASHDTQAIIKEPLAGGQALVLAHDSGSQARHAIAVDATSVYWTNADGEVVKVDISGSSVTVLATGQGDSSGIAVDADSVYFTNPSTSSVVKLTPK